MDENNKNNLSQSGDEQKDIKNISDNSASNDYLKSAVDAAKAFNEELGDETFDGIKKDDFEDEQISTEESNKSIETEANDYGWHSPANTEPPMYCGPKAEYYTGTPDNQKKSKEMKIFLWIIVVTVLLALTFGIGTILGEKYNNGSANHSLSDILNKNNEEKVTGDGTVITSKETPDAIETTGKKLSVEKIAEIGRASNVGVIVYTTNGLQNTQTGEGTGIVAKRSTDGKSTYILTCAHVITDGGEKVKILLEDGTTYSAEIVGFDRMTDLGVLKVATNKLTCVEFGDSSKLKVGSPVYAVGNPGGSEFFGSVTNGIVSSISRSINNEIGYTMECIQHNAAINPGNSGGALLNEYGQVIGINSSKIASTEYEGMGFSIPISTALEIANEIIDKGCVPNRPKLGISYSLAASHNTYAMVVQIKGLPAGSLIVRDISPDSDLANSKVQIGDMIVAVNGKELDTPDVLLDIIDKASVGDKLTFKICRVNTDYTVEEFSVTAKLVEDKGVSEPIEEETTYVNPFDFFNQNDNQYDQNNSSDYFGQFDPDLQ